MEQKENKFILRVYGILINQHNEVLLSDEFMLDMKMTKFPGGGLNFGEEYLLAGLLSTLYDINLDDSNNLIL